MDGACHPPFFSIQNTDIVADRKGREFVRDVLLMEVNNRNVLPQTNYRMNENNAAPVKVGDISSILIKERTGSNEAKVVLKGQEISVQFDGPVPSGDRALVEVTKQNENGQWTVKPINQPQTEATVNQADNVLKIGGFDPATHSELKEAVSGILSRGGSVSKNTLENLQEFLKSDVGSLDEKLDTIKLMQQKNIEFTGTQLNSVHLALHGQSLTESLVELAGPLDTSRIATAVQDTPSVLVRAIDQIKMGKVNEEAVEQVLSALDPSLNAQEIADIKKALQIIRAGKERMIQALPYSDLKQSVQQESNLANIINLLKKTGIPKNIAQVIQDALKLEKIGTARLEAAMKGIITVDEVTDDQADSALQDLTKLIQKEPRMSKVLMGFQSLLEEFSDSNLDLSNLKSAYEKASDLNKQGRELAARRELAAAISQLEESNPQLQKSTSQIGLSKAEHYLINEAVQSLALDSKNILVTEITKKLSQLALDFKKLRREISHNLDSASRLIEVNKQGSVVPVKQMLEATIKKLDNAILKGDFMLYTDMSTEKMILTASSKLAEARSHLTNGKLAEANQIVKEVKGVLDKLIFKPSDNRIKHFVSDKELLTPKSMLEKLIQPSQHHEPSARQIFEKLKALGLTHETDSAQALIDKQESPHNLKSALLKMMETETDQAKIPLEQAVANITGQQLLNKQDTLGIQNLLLQLPILLNKQVENVKIFVNSQKQGEKIDWENCSLYFVLETKKLGDVGILISAVNRNLSITVKNNRAGLQEVIKPLTEVTKDRLEEIGYNVGAIQFKPFSEATEETKSVNRPMFTPAFTKKGYDFSI